MDRQTIYSAAIPRSLDILQQEQNDMIALAKVAEAIFGTNGFVDGLSLVPTIPASLSATLGAGQVYQLAALEATNWSSIPADTTHQILKQGVALNTQTLTFTPPATGGFSQVFLVEVQYADQDANAVVLPYFNNATPFPQPPLNGPGGSGTPQNTTRRGIVSVQVKAGIAAATGTQTAPSADAGWIGLWLVTLANGATTISSGNIVAVSIPVVPSIAPKLPQVPQYAQTGSYAYARDVGGANAIVATLTPNQGGLTEGMEIKLKIAATNTTATTATINGTLYAVVHGDGTPLVANDLIAGQIALFFYDGSNLQTVRATVDPATLFQTGWPIWIPVIGTVPKFVRMNGLTIGTATSGATERANLDCLPLFIFCYLNYNDTICPVSGGRSGTTQAAAINDFNALKTIRLFDMRFRTPVGLTDMGNTNSGRSTGALFTVGDGTVPGSAGGEAAHTLTTAEIPAHTHANTVGETPHSHSYSRANSGNQKQQASGPVTMDDPNTTASTGTATAGVTISNASIGGGGAHNNMHPFVVGGWYQKL